MIAYHNERLELKVGCADGTLAVREALHAFLPLFVGDLQPSSSGKG